MTKSIVPKPPKTLSREARAWWQKIVKEWEFDNPALLILGTALTSFDRMREAQKILDKDGIVIGDRFGQLKQHPAALIERDAKSVMIRALKTLNLDIEPLHDKPGRPPGD